METILELKQPGPGATAGLLFLWPGCPDGQVDPRKPGPGCAKSTILKLMQPQPGTTSRPLNSAGPGAGPMWPGPCHVTVGLMQSGRPHVAKPSHTKVGPMWPRPGHAKVGLTQPGCTKPFPALGPNRFGALDRTNYL